MAVTEIIRSWAGREPGRLAVTSDSGTLTFAELGDRVDAFRAAFVEEGAGPGKMVAIIADRSPGTVAAILAVLEIGATCIPVHSKYPRERVNAILDQASGDLAFVVRDGSSAVSVGPRVLDMQDVSPLTVRPPERPQVDGSSIAYVLFTSGSTGPPKGVMISHDSLQAAVLELIRQYDIRPDDKVLHCAPLGFDTSISEIMRALCAGACLAIASTAVTDSPSFFYGLDFLADQSVTRAVLPAALLRSAWWRDLPALGLLVSTGEACTSEIVDRWEPGRRLLNAWGSTETTFCGTIMPLRPGRPGVQPIGRPVRIAEVFVVGDDDEPAAPGEVGELYVGGAGVSSGYYRRGDLNAERFVPNRWGHKSSRAFATRDLGRWLPDGNLECLGRLDHQIKVSGSRVDLLEIETALRGCARVAVADAVVVPVRTTSGTYLSAHVVLAAGSDEPPADPARQIRGELSDRLPRYAVPRSIRLVDALPLNAHGKTDRLQVQHTEERQA